MSLIQPPWLVNLSKILHSHNRTDAAVFTIRSGNPGWPTTTILIRAVHINCTMTVDKPDWNQVEILLLVQMYISDQEPEAVWPRKLQLTSHLANPDRNCLGSGCHSEVMFCSQLRWSNMVLFRPSNKKLKMSLCREHEMQFAHHIAKHCFLHTYTTPVLYIK